VVELAIVPLLWAAATDLGLTPSSLSGDLRFARSSARFIKIWYEFAVLAFVPWSSLLDGYAKAAFAAVTAVTVLRFAVAFARRLGAFTPWKRCGGVADRSANAADHSELE
jgi:hypothetical protein